MTDAAEALGAFRNHRASWRPTRDDPFRLECSFGEPATEAEIRRAWPDATVPAELAEAWLVSRRSMLFQDVEYGQWGLVILPPDQAAERTARERLWRPKDFGLGDLVVGEFLGDSELLVATPRADGSCQIRVALPLDPRAEWAIAAETLAEFLRNYLAAGGDKYWEPQYQPRR